MVVVGVDQGAVDVENGGLAHGEPDSVLQRLDLGPSGRERDTYMKILRAILNTIADIVMLPFRAIGRLLGAGESTAKGGRGRRR